jgi:hypothetical protein
MIELKTHLLIMLFLPAILLLNSCEGDGFQSVDCSECYNPEPDTADLFVRVTINGENPEVPLKVYKGKVEENRLEWIDTTSSSSYYLAVKTNEYYSVVATYKSGTRTILAVDGQKIRTQHVTDVCDDDCWIIKGGRLDARLKY